MRRPLPGEYLQLRLGMPAISQKGFCAMKQRLFTPGPTPVPEETLLELARPMVYHRTAEMRQLLGEVLEDLKYVYRTKNTGVALTPSSTGAMEAALVNSAPPGGKGIGLI